MQVREHDCNMVVGYSNYALNEGKTSLWHYDVHLQNILNYKVARHGKYTGGYLTHALICREHFLEQQGFSNQHTRLTIGTLPLLVEHLSKTGRVCASLSMDTRVLKVDSHASDFQQDALEHHIIYYYTCARRCSFPFYRNFLSSFLNSMAV